MRNANAIAVLLASAGIFSMTSDAAWRAGIVFAAQSAPLKVTPVLVELFTSEGCSSCPPADQLLLTLDARQDIAGTQVIVVSEHVDYWNHLGWRDPYSSAVWTERQEEYRDLLHQPEVYTPQAVVDGRHEVVGSDDTALRTAIAAAARSQKQPMSITVLDRHGDQVAATLSGGPFRDATVYAVLADALDHSLVAGGENAGHALDHVAVARTLSVIKDDQDRVLLTAPRGMTGHLRLIVFAQSKDGRMLAAAERTL